jgi:uncharacterized protein (TIGR02646 family)
LKQIKDYFDQVPKNLNVKHLENLKVFDEIILQKLKVEAKHYNRTGVKDALLSIFNHCCAYCEKRTSQTDPIEHFRPKKEDAYPWLGVAWSNFLMACGDCNTFKRDQFEIEGNKATLPYYKDWEAFVKNTDIRSLIFQKERCKMLHPVLDEPMEHLNFKEDGTVDSKSVRGAYFIECCALSSVEKRVILIQDRQMIIETFRNRIENYRTIQDVNELTYLIYNLLTEMIDGIETRPFSAVYRACFDNFDRFFIAKLDEPYQSKVRLIFKTVNE